MQHGSGEFSEEGQTCVSIYKNRNQQIINHEKDTFHNTVFACLDGKHPMYNSIFDAGEERF